MHGYSTDSNERRIVPFLLALLAIALAWASSKFPESNCRLSIVSAHMADDAGEAVGVATPTIYLRRPSRPTNDLVAKAK